MSTSKEPPRKKNRTFLERYTEYNDEADAWDSSQGGWTAQLPAQPAVMIARDIYFCRKVRGSLPVTFSQIFFHNFRNNFSQHSLKILLNVVISIVLVEISGITQILDKIR